MGTNGSTTAKQVITLIGTIFLTSLLTVAGASFTFQLSTSSRLATLEASIINMRENRARLERNQERLETKLDSILSLMRSQNSKPLVREQSRESM